MSQDLEPEYISIAGNTAYVTLQENNALAIINIEKATLLAWGTARPFGRSGFTRSTRPRNARSCDRMACGSSDPAQGWACAAPEIDAAEDNERW